VPSTFRGRSQAFDNSTRFNLAEVLDVAQANHAVSERAVCVYPEQSGPPTSAPWASNNRGILRVLKRRSRTPVSRSTSVVRPRFLQAMTARTQLALVLLVMNPL